MDKEEQMLVRHFADLSRAAWQRGRCMFTDFLNLNETSILQEHRKEFSGPFLLFGGMEAAERLMACFLPESGFPEEEAVFPIACIRAEVPGLRFSSGSLSHRDYLGAILGLGVDRAKLGDILVQEQGAFFFCVDKIAPFIVQELTQIGRQAVRCQEVSFEAEAPAPQEEEISGTVSSCRLDAVIGVAFRTSRGLSQELIGAGKVFVNAKEVLSAHFTPKEGDVVSVRGYGKFRFMGETGQSRKGRTQIRILKYK